MSTQSDNQLREAYLKNGGEIHKFSEVDSIVAPHIGPLKAADSTVIGPKGQRIYVNLNKITALPQDPSTRFFGKE